MFSLLRSGSIAFLVFLLHSLLLPNPLYAIPLQARQANSPTKTVTTVQTTDSSLGPVTVTCVLVFTPVRDAQGQEVVQVVKSCTLATAASQSGNEPPPASTTTSTLPPSTPTPTPSAVVSPSPVTETTSSTPTLSRTVLDTPTPTTQASRLGDDAATSTQTPTVQTSVASASGVSAAAAQLPGQKLSVLPIGLGVFAGISVIALIVVGLVTYERTKYRKAFRQRKLAEAGAEMGYGGMANPN